MSPQNTIKIRLNKMAVNTMYIIIKELYDAHYSFVCIKTKYGLVDIEAKSVFQATLNRRKLSAAARAYQPRNYH